MRLLRGVLAASAAIVFVLAVAACGGYGGDDNGEEGGSTTIGGMTAELHGTKDVSGETGKVEIEMDDNYFEPTVLEGSPGKNVLLELKNEGGTEHNFTLEDQSIDEDVEAGEETEVMVKLPQSGELSFYCKYHKDLGMAGALKAETG
jgi:plastocyanin